MMRKGVVEKEFNNNVYQRRQKKTKTTSHVESVHLRSAPCDAIQV